MFYIGSRRWPGITKLIEECAEVIQVASKLMASLGEVMHWDGTNLKVRLEEECGDVLGAIRFVVARCGLDGARVEERALRKLALFEQWQFEQAEPEPCPTGGHHREYELCSTCDAVPR